MHGWISSSSRAQLCSPELLHDSSQTLERHSPWSIYLYLYLPEVLKISNQPPTVNPSSQSRWSSFTKKNTPVLVITRAWTMAMLRSEPWANQPLANQPASQPAAFFLLATPACIKNPTTTTATITTYSSTLLQSELHRQVPSASSGSTSKATETTTTNTPARHQAHQKQQTHARDAKKPPHARLAGLPGIWIACKGRRSSYPFGQVMNRVLYFNPKVGLLYKPACGLYRYIIYLFNFCHHFRSGLYNSFSCLFYFKYLGIKI